MWTVHKVETKPREISRGDGFKTICPIEFEVPSDEKWVYMGLEQGCGGQPGKLVFIIRPVEPKEQGGVISAGGIYFK